MDDGVGNGSVAGGGGNGGGPSWLNRGLKCWREPWIHDHELFFLLGRINIFVMLPICVIGLIVNAIALTCLHRPPKITSGVFAYLKLLLTLDMVLLLVISVEYITPQICAYHYNESLHSLYQPCFIYRRFFENIFPRLTTSVDTINSWTIAALSAHRYWKISRPVVSRFKDTLGRARCILFVLVVTAIMFRLPLFVFELRIFRQPKLRISKSPQSTLVMNWYRFVYHSILDPILSRVIPLLMMSVFSLLTLVEISRSREFGYHKLKIDATINGKNGCAGGTDGQNGTMLTNGADTAPLSACFKRRRSNGVRQKQELRATVSIVLMVVLHVTLHSIQVFILGRTWFQLITDTCRTRSDYLISRVSSLLSMLSALINAFVFIAFTNRLKSYVEMLIRKTSRNLSSSSDQPHSPRVTTIEPSCLFDLEETRKYNDTPL